MRVWPIIVWAIIGVVLAQVGYALVVFFVFSGPDAMSTRGQFGDLFGAVTAFFTGLAFAGVIYTIYLQTVELELARQAQADQAADLNSARQAQADQVAALKESAAGLAEQVKNMRIDRETMIDMEKRRKAMEFISRFNDEYMVGLRAKAASALKAGTWKKEEHSVRAYLNFFEEMALAVDNDLADAELCRGYFRTPLLHVYTGAEDVFKGSPGTYRGLKKLAGEW
jgi:hypothetical protein